MGLEIYIGAEIEHDSERSLLAEIDRVWSSDPCSAIVFANVTLGGRQIDAIAIRDDLVLVLEGKSYGRAVRGGPNGHWQVRMPSGDWRDCPNAWTQVLGEKNALRDAMQAFDGSMPNFYPEASVVFVPKIPLGSELMAGDFKASIVGGNDVGSRLREVHRNCWDLAKWRAFAAHHRLRKVTSLATALSPNLLLAESRLADYVQQFSWTYAAEADEFIESPCHVDNEQDFSPAVIDKIVNERTSVVVDGSSGCGKTLFAKKVGVTALREGGMPVYIRAHEFEGHLKPLLDREVGLLSSSSAAAILGAARQLNRHVLLVLDGYNECGVDRRGMLVRAIAALARRYAATVVVTSQIPLAHSDLLATKRVTIPLPSHELKRAIASKATGGRSYSLELEKLLASVASGLEAHLVGVVGSEMSAEASRFAIFDAFVRGRLGGHAREGVRALSLVAGWLTDRCTFGISIRDLDRLSLENSVPASVGLLLRERNLLIYRGDRVMFSHELFLNAFAAESVVRCAGGSVEKIVAAIDRPVHADASALIVGAIDDHGLLVRVLERLSSTGLLAACNSGFCGRAAREWVESRFPVLFAKMLDEIRGLKFRIAEDTWSNIATDTSAKSLWPAGERALLGCVPDLMATGVLLDEALNVVEEMDALIARETERLREAAKTAKVGLRTSMFASAYVVQRPDAPAIGQVCSRLRGGLFKRSSSAALTRRMREVVAQGTVTPGQMNVLVALSRSVEADSVLAATFVTWGLTTFWLKAPYHLRLAMADAAGYRRDVPEPQRSDIVAALESLLSNDEPLLNTPIFESLQRLGASEAMEAEHVGSVREHLAQLLVRRDEESAWEEANGLYNCQFDHPYSNAYVEAVDELPTEDRNTFLLMAGRGARSSFFLSLLLRDVCGIGGPVACEILERWTALPPADPVSPQEAIEVFVIAHESLGRLHGELPPKEDRKPKGAAAAALRACGAALYWSNRIDLSVDERHARSVTAWSELGTWQKGAALVAIQMCAEWHMLIRNSNPAPGAPETIPHFFPEETTDVCRRALAYPREQNGYFQYFCESDRQSALAFAFDILGEYGNSADLILLRRWSHDPGLGRFAIRAIGGLEARLTAGV
jgi:hypothetical protein